MLRVAIVNRFYPPDPAITGKEAHELVAHLRAHVPEAEIRVFASSARYRGGGGQTGDGDEVERVRGFRTPDRGALRLAASLSEGYRLAKRAVRWADVVVSLTDPPLLGLWIGREVATAGRNVRWIEWTMDLYPEAFAAAGLVGTGNPAYRYLSRRVGRTSPDRYICLGPAQHAAVQRLRGCARPATILPAGIVDRVAPPTAPPDWRVEEPRVVIAYAGNLGEAHCADALVGLVRQADPARFAFMFALSGSRADHVRAALRDRTNVIWRHHLDSVDLALADVHVATLKRRWAHVCVPSKAVSTICLGRPMLFIGPAEGDTLKLLGEAAWHLPDSADGRYDAESLRRVLERIGDADERAARELAARRIRVRLMDEKRAAFRELAAWLHGGVREVSYAGAAATGVPVGPEAVAAE